MPRKFHLGACVAMRVLKLSQFRVLCGVHPTSASAGKRGTARYCTAARLRTVSDQSGASTPTMFASVTPFIYVAGSQSYASRTSMSAAQVRPSSVVLSYFMSISARLEGDMRTLAPYFTAAAAVVSEAHACEIVVGFRGACEISSQPTMCLPCFSTIADRKSTRLNSSHLVISYAVFCLKKKNKYTKP